MKLDLTHSPVAREYFASNGKFDVLTGPVGSGKTSTMIARMERHIREQKPGPDGVARSRVLIARQTYQQLKATSLQTLLHWLPEHEYDATFEVAANRYRRRFRHPDGHVVESEILLRALDGADDVADLLSLELTFAVLNELKEFDQLIVSNLRPRCNRYPSASQGGCTFSGVIADSNPWPDTSYLMDWLVHDPAPGFNLFRQPGGLSDGAENLPFLGQTAESLQLPPDHPDRIELGRQYYREALLTYDSYDAASYVHSQWSQQRGRKPVYVDFSYDDHVADFEADPQFPIQLAADPGLSCAAVLGQVTPNGIRIADEVMMFETGLDQFVERLLSKIAAAQQRGYRLGMPHGWLDPAGDARNAAADANTTRDLMARRGLHLQPCRTNAIGVRVDTTNRRFRARPTSREGILIHPRCKELIVGCQREYVYKQLRIRGGERHADTPDKQNPYSHICDALQYFCVGVGGAIGGPGVMDQEQFAKACAAASRRNSTWNVFNT